MKFDIEKVSDPDRKKMYQNYYRYWFRKNQIEKKSIGFGIETRQQ